MAKKRIVVKTPFNLHVTEDFARDHGLEGTTKAFGIGNHTVPEGVADHPWVQRHSEAEQPADEPDETEEESDEEETPRFGKRKRK